MNGKQYLNAFINNTGEKDRIIDRINEISGYGDEVDETAKN